MNLKPIPGFPGYFISDQGVVVSRKKGLDKTLRLFQDKEGYLKITLVPEERRNGLACKKSIKIHVAMMRAWGPPRPSLEHEIRHLDDKKANNSISNLCWGTRLDNMQDRKRNGLIQYGPANAAFKYPDDTIAAVKGALAKGYKQCDVARRFGISQSYVSEINSGKKRSTA